MNDFTHLHLHTEYSLLDGVGKIKEYIKRAKELNFTSLAITDHGNMFGAMEFYKECRKENIKPIIGIEVYIPQKEGERKNYHLVLLAKNEIGYRNLLKISSIGYKEGFYYKPRVTKEIIKQYSEGLIGLSGCIAGEVATKLLHGDKDGAKMALYDYDDMFESGDFYIELQAIEKTLKDQKMVNKKLKELADENNIKTVATNDVHYVNKGEYKLQEILLCISSDKKIKDKDRFKLEATDLYLKSREEMLKDIPKYRESIDNVGEVINKCNLYLEFNKVYFPDYKIPNEYKNEDEFLKHIIRENYFKKYTKNNIIARDRIRYEYKVITKMGFSTYFIVVWDFIKYAKENDIPIGPGRGSAAGSIIAYILGITMVDPLKYNLLFERFLNPERVSLPDIDIDICQQKRGDLIEYVINKYGKDKVAQIITFGRMQARSSIRDICRVGGIDPKLADRIAKLIPFGMNLTESLEESEELKNLYTNNMQCKKIIDISLRIENKVRQSGTHAAGVIISGKNIDEICPLYKHNKTGAIATQYQMGELEELGLIKMDFLGLKNLTCISNTLKKINNLNIDLIPLDDKKTYELLQNGDTVGIFQVESDGMKNLLKRIKPDKFEDIIAILALYRPGPLGSGMVDDFINGKHGGEIRYIHDDLKGILGETYGVMLYQEQIMKISNVIAGFSLPEADNLRKAIGKKIPELMKKSEKKFIKGGKKKGYTKDFIIKLFDLIKKFAEYGFNKSHSTAYALITYQTAYLKANYPIQYYASLMTTERGDTKKIRIFLNDAKKKGIIIQKPSINYSTDEFQVINDKIFYSLFGIKGVKEKTVNKIIEERENGLYKSYGDFVFRMKKVGVNKVSIKALIEIGALDDFKYNKKTMIENLESILKYLTKEFTKINRKKIVLDSSIENYIISQLNVIEWDEYSENELLEFENNNLEIYLSGNPLNKYDHSGITKLEDISKMEGEKINILANVKEFKKIKTKKGGDMAILNLTDYEHDIKCLTFPQKYYIIKEDLSNKNIIVKGEVKNSKFNGNEEWQIIMDSYKVI